MAPAKKVASTSAKPAAAKKTKRAGKTGGTKKLSPYNKFMKSELAKVKSSNPGMAHKDAFKKVAQMWKTSSLNPKFNAIAAQ